MRKYLLIALLLAAALSSVAAKRKYKEKTYQEHFAEECRQGGKELAITEHRLSDGTRVDILTKTYAIEADFANKWAESIGQALYYALSTGKNPGVLLIMEDPAKDLKYYYRLQTVAAIYGITIWTIDADFYSELRFKP